MPTFNDSEAMNYTVQDEMDCVLQVLKMSTSISKGAKTNGSTVFEFEFLNENTNSRFFDDIIDHESCAWKIDQLLKANGIKIAKGEAFEFEEDAAKSNGVRFVNPIGLRFHARIKKEEFTYKTGAKAGQKGYKNRISVFYTDKGTLEPIKDVFAD